MIPTEEAHVHHVDVWLINCGSRGHHEPEEIVLWYEQISVRTGTSNWIDSKSQGHQLEFRNTLRHNTNIL